MKKKRFYNNKKRNAKWTEEPKGRKISFADKYIDAGTGSDKFDKMRPKQRKKPITKDKLARIFKGFIVVIACFAVVCTGYTVMDLYMERNAMPVKDETADDAVKFSEIDLKLKALNIDSISLDGGVMLEAVINEASGNAYPAVSFDIKRDDGTIGYESSLATIDAYGAVSSAAAELEKSVASLRENDIIPVARLSCYKDNIAPVADLSCAVMNKKSIYRDLQGNSYMNPESSSTYNYLKGIVEEVSGMGVNVFVLDNLYIPEEAQAGSQGFEELRKRLYVDFGDNIKFIEAKHIDLSQTKSSEFEKIIKDNFINSKDIIYYIATSDADSVRNILSKNSFTGYVIIKTEPVQEAPDDEYEDYDDEDRNEESIDENDSE